MRNQVRLCSTLTSFLTNKLSGQDCTKFASRFSTHYESDKSDKSSASGISSGSGSGTSYTKFSQEDQYEDEDKYEGKKRKNVVRSYKGLITFATFGAGALIISQSYLEKKKFLSVVKSSALPVVLASSTLYAPPGQGQTPQDFLKSRHINIGSTAGNTGKKDHAQVEKPNRMPFTSTTGKTHDFIADVVEKVSSSVVCINVKDHSIHSWTNNNHISPKTVQNGSGFIISEDGLILTNAHVVDIRGRSSIMVELEDGRTFAGIIEEIDPIVDLALVRINVKGLSTMPLEDSNKKLRPGSWVISIGNPMSLSNSVCVGVISCVRRESKALGVASDIGYIQTDATITMGNSGGPLVNLDGKAIGVNSMKITPGISFAIPIDYVKKFVENYQEARKNGKVIQMKRYLGVTLITLTEVIIDELERKNNFKTPRDHNGVFIFKVVVGSPADIAGLQPGDIITHLNDVKVKSARQVHDAIEVHHNLKIKLWRNNEYIETHVIPENVHINSPRNFPKNDNPQNVVCNLAQKDEGSDIDTDIND